MNKETTFTEVITNTYKVTDVSPEDGITFDFAETKNKSKKLGIKWPLKEDNCKKCKKAFQKGDRMYLAITDKGNVFICKDCAKQLRKELGIPDYCKPENINKQ